MSGFFSPMQVVPMETLPGWPPAQDPSALTFLLAFVGIPALLLSVLALLIWAPALGRAARGQTRGGREPLWLGSTSSPKALASDPRVGAAGGASQAPTRESLEVNAEGGVSFTPAEIDDLKQALHDADAQSGLDFSLFVGAPADQPRQFAEGLLSAQPDPATAVVVVVDPESRGIEIATGEQATRQLDDADCALAAAGIQRAATDGALTGGIVDALNLLGNAAREIPSLHGSTEFHPEH
ncbi:DUF5130 family protein [Naumannella huperziae]